MHTYLCKNCTHTFQGNFCSNCGQKTNTQRLNWQYILEELKYTFLHINNGLLFTAKQLYTRPGNTVREFIEGKRVKHYKPILMVFVLAGINGLLLHYIKIEKYLPVNKFNKNNLDSTKQILEWITTHYALTELLFLPLISIASWITYRKWGYNYIENIIINSFATSQRLIFSILTFPVLFLLQEQSLSLKNAISIPEYLLTIWLYWQLYSTQTVWQRISKLLLFITFLLTLFFSVIIIAVIGYLSIINL